MFFKKRKFIKISRVSKKSIYLTNNINFIFINNNLILTDSFKKSQLKLNLYTSIVKKKNYIFINSINKNKFSNVISGTIRSILFNIINGFINFYEKKLLLIGIGYKALLHYNYLYLYLGYTHPVIYILHKDINLVILSFTEIIITGIDKQKVNQVASFLRNIKKPHPYKGTGVRYFNEKLNLKIFKKK